MWWRLALRIALYLFAFPFILIWLLIRSLFYLRRLRYSLATSIRCSNCGSSISLVGLWRCKCGYTYRGHLMRRCPICGRTPRLLRCPNCQVTEVLW